MAVLNIAPSFESFCKLLRFSDDDTDTISGRYHTITKRINIDYRGSTSDMDYSLYVGSYGRGTEISTSDIDMLVQLPYETYARFNAYLGNGQSALLQEVKKVLEKTYSITNLKADGQIISIPFSDGINFEVLPAFINKDGSSYTFANSNAGGSWKTTDPRAEISAMNQMNAECNNNLKRLCRMARAWRDKNSVSISGIMIDIQAYRFLSSWKERNESYLYYDWMTRDFMLYLSNVSSTQNSWQVMGSNRYIYHSGYFQAKAKEAYLLAVDAISKEKDAPYTAVSKWRDIYGTKFPSL